MRTVMHGVKVLVNIILLSPHFYRERIRNAEEIDEIKRRNTFRFFLLVANIFFQCFACFVLDG